MEKGNALVFANKRADLFLADGGGRDLSGQG